MFAQAARERPDAGRHREGEPDRVPGGRVGVLPHARAPGRRRWVPRTRAGAGLVIRQAVAALARARARRLGRRRRRRPPARARASHSGWTTADRPGCRSCRRPHATTGTVDAGAARRRGAGRVCRWRLAVCRHGARRATIPRRSGGGPGSDEVPSEPRSAQPRSARADVWRAETAAAGRAGGVGHRGARAWARLMWRVGRRDGGRALGGRRADDGRVGSRRRRRSRVGCAAGAPVGVGRRRRAGSADGPGHRGERPARRRLRRGRRPLAQRPRRRGDGCGHRRPGAVPSLPRHPLLPGVRRPGAGRRAGLVLSAETEQAVLAPRLGACTRPASSTSLGGRGGSEGE